MMFLCSFVCLFSVCCSGHWPSPFFIWSMKKEHCSFLYYNCLSHRSVYVYFCSFTYPKTELFVSEQSSTAMSMRLHAMRPCFILAAANCGPPILKAVWHPRVCRGRTTAGPTSTACGFCLEVCRVCIPCALSLLFLCLCIRIDWRVCMCSQSTPGASHQLSSLTIDSANLFGKLKSIRHWKKRQRMKEKKRELKRLRAWEACVDGTKKRR